ncbi:phage baseplate assembly protein V [Myxococcota bacterium]|nr:phage baseplate assembly protein V [Myxococcota bacterium]
MRDLAEVLGRVAELERRVYGMVRHGTVAEVDPAQGLVRLKLGPSTSGGDFLGPWVPYSQMAGAIKAHVPPSVGQQFTLIAPSGDLRQSVAVPMTWSDQNSAPSGAGDQNVLTYGNARLTLADDLLEVEVGGSLVRITGDEIRLSTGGSSIVLSAAGVAVNGARIDLN